MIFYCLPRADLLNNQLTRGVIRPRCSKDRHSGSKEEKFSFSSGGYIEYIGNIRVAASVFTILEYTLYSTFLIKFQVLFCNKL